jgi:hypothetical protein
VHSDIASAPRVHIVIPNKTRLYGRLVALRHGIYTPE